MIQQEFVPQIPYGTRDFLPREAYRKRLAEARLAQLFAAWGYDEVITPTMETVETLVTGAGSDMQADWFKFFDTNNRTLALRPDMTTPIARVAATRLREEALPLKLFYLSNVFRHEQAQAGRQCEFYQAGVELLGEGSAAADAEVIALAVQALQEAGLQDFCVSLGQVDFIRGIMQESGLRPEQQQAVKQAMVARDLVGLENTLAKSDIHQQTQSILREVPLLYGSAEVLQKAHKMAANPVSRAAIDNLLEIYQLLLHYGVAQYVQFDLGIIRDFDYYTGMVMEAYTPGLGFPVCGGGRYDTMLQAFGVDCAATGFALGIERILLAQERQGMRGQTAAKDVYIAWATGYLPAALVQAAKLRAAGQTVEVAMAPQPQAIAEQCRLRKGYQQLLYVTAEGVCGDASDK